MGKVFSRAIVLSLVLLLILVSDVSANNERYIESGSTLTNTVYQGERNWYTFTTTEDNGDMYIYLSNETAPVRFSVYNSNKTLISNYNQTFFDSLKAGTYYIEVYSYGWGSSYSRGSYDLTATYADGKNEHHSSTLEPNDTRENAYKLTSGKKITTSLSTSYDRDFFEITNTKDNGDIYIYLANSTAPVRFNLYDSNKTRISISNTSYFRNLKAGKYYIEVYPYSWGSQYSSGKYDLIATFSTPTVKHDSNTFEPNDTRENAFPLTSGKAIKPSLDSSFDRDFYSITLDREGYVNIGLSGTTAPARFDIYSSDKSRLSSYNTSYNRKLKAGTYYIEVYPYNWGNSYSKGNYTLMAGFPNNNVVKSEILLTLNSRTVKVNGKNQTLLAAPYIKNATTLVPIRLISEQLGANVQWKSSDQSINIVLDGTSIEMRIGSQYVYVNGDRQLLRMAPELRNGTTFVPVRFISEQYGRNVGWNSKTQQISIK